MPSLNNSLHWEDMCREWSVWTLNVTVDHTKTLHLNTVKIGQQIIQQNGRQTWTVSNSFESLRSSFIVVPFGPSDSASNPNRTGLTDLGLWDHPYIMSAYWLGGCVQKNCPFCWHSVMYFKYLCWHSRKVQKSPKMCWRNIWTVPITTPIVVYHFELAFDDTNKLDRNH